MTEDIYDDEPDEEFCQVEPCENPFFEVQPASLDLTTIETRRMCRPCAESYGTGAQHGEFRAIRNLLRRGYREAAEALLGRPISDAEIEQVRRIDPGNEWGG
jgi:hypothetical protein